MNAIAFRIISIASTLTRCPMEHFRSTANRYEEITRARAVVARLLRERLNLSYPEIAAELGMTSHASAIEAVRRGYSDDPKIAADYALVARYFPATSSRVPTFTIPRVGGQSARAFLRKEGRIPMKEARRRARKLDGWEIASDARLSTASDRLCQPCATI